MFNIEYISKENITCDSVPGLCADRCIEYRLMEENIRFGVSLKCIYSYGRFSLKVAVGAVIVCINFWLSSENKRTRLVMRAVWRNHGLLKKDILSPSKLKKRGITDSLYWFRYNLFSFWPNDDSQTILTRSALTSMFSFWFLFK